MSCPMMIQESWINKLGSKYIIDLDLRTPGSTVLVSGMGRSGTTWIAGLINWNNLYREIFEPFHPYSVRTAKPFGYLQYISPETSDPTLVTAARKILSGRVRSEWTDSHNSRLFSTKRLIKDIRTNLMLAWLKRIRPNMPIVLVMRHPLSVISSWAKLGWGIESGGQESDFHRIVSQENLMIDFPLIEKALFRIDQDSYFERLLLVWCILYYVPLNQLKKGEYLLSAYENYIFTPKSEIEKLFRYLGERYDKSKIAQALTTESRTNFLGRSHEKAPGQRMCDWKTEFNSLKIGRAKEILDIFGLDIFYHTCNDVVDINQCLDLFNSRKSP